MLIPYNHGQFVTAQPGVENCENVTIKARVLMEKNIDIRPKYLLLWRHYFVKI